MSQSSSESSDEIDSEGDCVELIYYSDVIYQWTSQSYSQYSQRNGFDVNEMEECHTLEQSEQSQVMVTEEIHDNQSQQAEEGSVSSDLSQQEGVQTIKLSDSKYGQQHVEQFQPQIIDVIVQQQDPTNPPLLQERISKQKKNRTKNIPRIYGGYLLKYWKGLMQIQSYYSGCESDEVRSQIKSIEKMKPKTLRDINFLRKYQSFRELSVAYLESNQLLFDFLESDKIQDIQPLIEVMNQYYLSFKNNKKLKNQTISPHKKVRRD